MKNLKSFFVATVLLLSGSAVIAGPSEGFLGFSFSKDKNLFVVRADKHFEGAKVEIFATSGQLLTVQTVEKKKLYIDFGDAVLGTYTIKVTKDEKVQEYQFTKK